MMKNRTPVLLASLALVLTACSTQENTPDPLATVATNAPATENVEAPTAAASSRVLHPDPNPGMTPGGTEEQQKVALEAAKTMTTWTPEKDATRTDAEKRASKMMTKDRAARVIAPKRAPTDAEWTAAQKAGAQSVPTVELNPYVDGGVVEVQATWTWETPDGAPLPATGPQQTRYYRFAFSPEEPEKIADYTYQDRIQR